MCYFDIWAVRAVMCAAVLWVAACTGVGGGMNRETLEAELTEYVSEATRINTTREAAGTQAAATVAAAETYVTLSEGINIQLASTLRAVVPPTQQIIVNTGPVTPGMIAPLPGQITPEALPADAGTPAGGSNVLTEIAIALSVRDQDGCAAGTVTSVSSGASRVYATTRILNAQAGAQVRADWYYEGNLVVQGEPYALPRNAPDFCVWFYIEPSDAPFQPGTWQAQFVLNGIPVTPSATFTMN